MSDENTDDSRKYSETIGTRLTPQTKQKFDNYREENELGKTKAARRLIKQSLDKEVRRQMQLPSSAVGLAYIAAFTFGGSQAGAAVGGAYIATILVWSAWPIVE